MAKRAPKKRKSEKSRINPWAVMLTASGWIAAVALGLLDLPAKINSFFVEYPKAAHNVLTWLRLDADFTGSWTSNIEGWIGATPEQQRLQGGEAGPVAVNLRVYDGEVEGEITSAGLEKGWPWSAVPLQGKKVGDRLDVQAIDFVDGQPRILAKLEIRYSKTGESGSLAFKAIEQGWGFFPAEAALHRDDNAMADAHKINKQFLEQAKRFQRKD